MLQKTILIEISTSDLQLLYTNGYSLCVAKKVNGSYNVVWQASNSFLMNNTISWSSSFQIFTTASFTPGAQVSIDNGPLDISLGQKATLDTRGFLLDGSGDAPDSITFLNNITPTHPGLSGLSVGPGWGQQSTPIFVSSLSVQNSSTLLTPVEMVQVWFQQLVTSGSMISGAAPNAVEIDLTQADSATRRYQNGTWSTVAAEA
jgi:hypothetical protein